jgi:hypothetical protein
LLGKLEENKTTPIPYTGGIVVSATLGIVIYNWLEYVFVNNVEATLMD